MALTHHFTVAAYLKIHPGEAHELMVPSGFKECMVRRYERFLSTESSLSSQNGALEEARWSQDIFDKMMPGSPVVVSNGQQLPTAEVTWRQVNTLVCKNAHDTLSGDALAPQLEDIETGARIRTVKCEGLLGTSSDMNFPEKER